MSILRFQLLPHAYQVALRIMKKRVSTEVAIDGAWTRSHVLARRTGRDERVVELGIGRKLPAESLLVKRLARSESSAGTSK